MRSTVRFWNLTASQPTSLAILISFLAISTSPWWLMPASPITKHLLVPPTLTPGAIWNSLGSKGAILAPKYPYLGASFCMISRSTWLSIS